METWASEAPWPATMDSVVDRAAACAADKRDNRPPNSPAASPFARAPVTWSAAADKARGKRPTRPLV